MKNNQRDKFSWLEAELNETYDEMFEAEFSEPMLPDEFWKIYKGERPDTLEKKNLFSQFIKAANGVDKITGLGGKYRIESADNL
jgi:hypothetical protein